jgi:hypothetical protein
MAANWPEKEAFPRFKHAFSGVLFGIKRRKKSKAHGDKHRFERRNTLLYAIHLRTFAPLS